MLSDLPRNKDGLFVIEMRMLICFGERESIIIFPAKTHRGSLEVIGGVVSLSHFRTTNAKAGRSVELVCSWVNLILAFMSHNLDGRWLHFKMVSQEDKFRKANN